jgi:hypothetical protein
VAGTLEFKSNGKAIAIGFTDRRLSPYAGSAIFWDWLRPLDWAKRLAAALPQRQPTSNNHLLPLAKALAFMPASFTVGSTTRVWHLGQGLTGLHPPHLESTCRSR